VLLEETIGRIGDLNGEVSQAACQRQDSLTKPPGSLGMLEDVAIKIAGITGQLYPQVDKKTVITMAGDHGVCAEGVNAYPQNVTPQMILNFLHGGAAVNVLSRHAGSRVVAVDMGIVAPLEAPGLLVRRIGPGTANMAVGPAMTREQARAAVEAGIEIASQEIAGGTQLLATGDMGIGNTTPSTAILAAFTGFPVAMLSGKGTGLDSPGMMRKIKAIEKALDVNRPDPRDGLDVLSKVGGFEIGGLAGVILGGAAAHVPVVIDGFISGAAAMIAKALAPKSINFMIASHLSEEPGHKVMCNWLGIQPMLHMNMRLGEGSGAVLTFPLIDAALKVMSEMATFEEAGVSEKE
jgi:nicotinate-nucleotide--dimethylbenzimidazole phosphoribosyltransferase